MCRQSSSWRWWWCKLNVLITVWRCVIAELFTEGTSPFDLSQLLAYRAGEYSLSKLFHTIDDINIRVSDLLQFYIHCSVANFVFGGETINTFCKHLKIFFLFQEVGAFVIVQFLCNFYKCSYLLTYIHTNGPVRTTALAEENVYKPAANCGGMVDVCSGSGWVAMWVVGYPAVSVPQLDGATTPFIPATPSSSNKLV